MWTPGPGPSPRREQRHRPATVPESFWGTVAGLSQVIFKAEQRPSPYKDKAAAV